VKCSICQPSTPNRSRIRLNGALYWVPEGHRNSNSGRKLVLMKQAAQHIAPANAGMTVRAKGSIGQSFGRLQAEASMRPSGIVVRGVGSKDSLQMPAAEDQNPVGIRSGPCGPCGAQKLDSGPGQAISKLGLIAVRPTAGKSHSYHSPYTMFKKRMSRPMDGSRSPIVAGGAEQVERTRRKTWSRPDPRFLCPSGRRRS
jgi:hypothetical protein